MFLATIAFTGMHAAIRGMSANLHPFEIAFFRNLFGLFVVAPWFVRFGLQPLRTRRLGLHGVRALLNVVAMLSFFYALSLIPLAEATALGFSAPLFATLLAIPLLGEVVGWRRWSAILVGFAGTLVVTRPGMQALDLGHILMIGSTAVWGFALIVIKMLGRTESAVTITSYMLLLMVPLSFVPAALVWQWPTAGQFGWLVAIGIMGTVAQLLMTQALKEGDTNTVMPLDFFKLIWAGALGYLLFSEVPDLFTWLGGAMIFASVIYITLRERALARRRVVLPHTKPPS